MKITQFMEKFGRPVSLHDDNDWSSGNYCAFIQPLRYKNKMYLYGVNTQIGFNSQGHYLYIGPPDHDLTTLEEGSWIKAGDEKYQIDRAERVCCGEELFYIWAIIRTIVEE